MASIYAAILVFFTLWIIEVALKKLFDIELNRLLFALLAGVVSFVAFSMI